jgi:capsular polysaccharide biosynthesis protein
MQLRDYVRIVAARWCLVLIVGAAAAAASYLYTRTQAPVYRSTTTMVFVPARPDNGQTLAAQNLSRQAAAQISTEALARAVDERNHFDLGPDVLKGKVRANATTEQALLTIEVNDSDPERARRLAAAFAQEFADRHADRMANVDPRDRIDVEVNDQARLGTQVWPQTRSTVLAGLLLGAIGGVALAFGAEWLDDTYHDAGEVERGTGLTVLGAIPHLPTAR